ncbi:MAG TPA: hypothetical protein PLP29_06865 [Candidatus Ozemobacteraceae bacterium]|nr:hypothetical protein [Candidatus Ozemobacteraceae bacterium]
MRRPGKAASLAAEIASGFAIEILAAFFLAGIIAVAASILALAV